MDSFQLNRETTTPLYTLFREDVSHTISDPSFLPADFTTAMQDTSAGDANLQSTPADMLSMFQVCMDTAINSIPSDRVKAWLLLCQEQLTPQSHNYWKVEIKHLYIEYLAYPTIFHSVYVMILKKGTNHEIIMALHNEAFVGLIIDMVSLVLQIVHNKVIDS
ncbi:hypothetical protein V8B97DRAFT_1878597 [Scleroderma yunnanense]